MEGLQTFEKSDSWLCQNGQGPWVKDLNGEGNSYNSNTRGAGQSGGGGGSGPWFQCDVSVTVDSNNMQVTSNAIPNHNWLSAFAANADEQNMDWTIPLNPVEDTTGGHNSVNCPAANGAYECAPDRVLLLLLSTECRFLVLEEGPGGDAVALEFLYFDEDRQQSISVIAVRTMGRVECTTILMRCVNFGMIPMGKQLSIMIIQI